MDTNNETTCADCGAAFVASNCTTGYAETAVPRLPFAKVRTLLADGTNLGTVPRALRIVEHDPRSKGASYWPAAYDVEGEQAAHDAKQKLPRRRICYACCAILETETMIARGRTSLYLSREGAKPGEYGTHTRRIPLGIEQYNYKLSNWPGSADFQFVGRVKESKGRGFGGSYPVHTFRFKGPDGFVWSGRNAGDMQMARCKRTKERVKTS